MLLFHVSNESAGTRADLFATRELSLIVGFQLSRKRVKMLFDAGAVIQVGKALKPSNKIKQGDLIVNCDEDTLASLKTPSEFLSRIVPVKVVLDAIYEDDKLVVINKPTGMSVHPSAGDSDPTIVAALMHRWGVRDIELGIGAQLSESKQADIEIDELDVLNSSDAIENMKNALLVHRIGIVHRLDKMTSGCLVVARDSQSHAFISEQFASRQTRKEYIAITVGVPKESKGIIEAPIARHSRDRTRYIAISSGDSRLNKGKSRYARTDYEHVSTSSGLSLIKLQIHTGRTHQIRVHLKHIGLEILGDSLYGTSTNARFLKFLTGTDLRNAPSEWLKSFDATDRERLASALDYDGEICRAGQMLHARLIEVEHPDGRILTLVSSFPCAFTQVCEIAALDISGV